MKNIRGCHTLARQPHGSLFAYLGALILALLVGNAAAGLAGRLARGLALAAAAVLRAGAKVAGLYGDYVFHTGVPFLTAFAVKSFIQIIIPQKIFYVNTFFTRSTSCRVVLQLM